MHNRLCVILILRLILSDAHGWSSHRSHCLTYLRHHQPSIGHHLLRIEQSIDNEQSCDHRCSMDHSCSMATFHQRHHRCHLFRHHRRHSLSHPFRSHQAYSTFAHCPGRFLEESHVTSVHCDYDSWVSLLACCCSRWAWSPFFFS